MDEGCPRNHAVVRNCMRIEFLLATLGGGRTVVVDRTEDIWSVEAGGVGPKCDTYPAVTTMPNALMWHFLKGGGLVQGRGAGGTVDVRIEDFLYLAVVSSQSS